jgi:hypothetical protein
MTDADIETAELHHVAACEAIARRHGVCFHNGTVGPIGAAQHGYTLTAVQRLCLDCGTTFRSDAAWLAARYDIIEEWT